MHEIILLRRAIFDIDKIEQDSVEKWGKKVADEYINDIDEALQLLSEFPNLLKKFEFSDVLYFYPVRKHSLFCTLCHDKIYVLTVKYGGMDLKHVMRNLEPMLVNELEIMQRKLEKSAESE